MIRTTRLYINVYKITKKKEEREDRHKNRYSSIERSAISLSISTYNYSKWTYDLT